MNIYIAKDLANDFFEYQLSFYEEKKTKELKIGDYINIGYGLYTFQGTLLRQNTLYMNLLTKDGENETRYIYEPDKIVTICHVPYKIGDYLQIQEYIAKVISIQAHYPCIYYTCSREDGSRPLHFTIPSTLRIKLYRERDKSPLESILERLDSIEKRLNRLENKFNR